MLTCVKKTGYWTYPSLPYYLNIHIYLLYTFSPEQTARREMRCERQQTDKQWQGLRNDPTKTTQKEERKRENHKLQSSYKVFSKYHCFPASLSNSARHSGNATPSHPSRHSDWNSAAAHISLSSYTNNSVQEAMFQHGHSVMFSWNVRSAPDHY